MEKTKKISNLDTLEREIFRLELQAGKTAEKLEKNAAYLQDHFMELARNSFFTSCRQKPEEKQGFFESVVKNDIINGFVTKVSDHITSQAIERIDRLAAKLFHKKKKKDN